MARAPAVSAATTVVVIIAVVSAGSRVPWALPGELVGEVLAGAGGECARDLGLGPVALAVLYVLVLLPAGVVAEVYVRPAVLAVDVVLVLLEGVHAAAGVLELDGDDVVAAEEFLADLADLPALGEVLPRLLLGRVFAVFEDADRPR